MIPRKCELALSHIILSLRIWFPESVNWRFAANFVQLHKTENLASGKRQLALSGVPDLMEMADGIYNADTFSVCIMHQSSEMRSRDRHMDISSKNRRNTIVWLDCKVLLSTVNF